MRGRRSEASRAPIQAPISRAGDRHAGCRERPPRAAASRSTGSASGCATTPYSAAMPIVPIRPPDAAPKTSGRSRGDAQGDDLDEQRLDDVEREARRRLAEHRADEDRDHAADDEEEARPRPAPSRGRARRGSRPAPSPAAHRDQHRLEDEAELGDAEVELGLEDREADQEGAGERDPAQRRPIGQSRARSPAAA